MQAKHTHSQSITAVQVVCKANVDGRGCACTMAVGSSGRGHNFQGTESCQYAACFGFSDS
jgi:hypothetical protein